MKLEFNSLPPHLAQDQATGLCENAPIAQFEIGQHKNFVYLILCWQTKEAAIVDPQLDLEPLLAPLAQHGFKLTQVLLTHTHWDHVAGVPELLKKFPTLPIRVHAQDQHRLSIPSTSIVLLQDQEQIRIGDLLIEALHTPGHSAGECCFFVSGPQPYLFTGDTVFIRDCGRTDFEDGSDTDLFQSLLRIRKLPAETIFLPGHHYQKECATTLARELIESPPFRCNSVEELASLP